MNRGMGLLLAAVLMLGACSEQAAPSGKAPAPPAVQAPAQTAPPVPPPAKPEATPKTPEAPAKVEPAPNPAPPAVPAAAPPSSPATAPGVTPLDQVAEKWFISVERAKELFDAKEVNGRQVIFVDARTFLEFRDDGHVRGAMHYAKNYTMGPPQPKVRNYLPGSAVVIYCHGETCTDSIEVGRYFEALKMDIGPVFVMKDGIPAWKKAYPDTIDKGNEVGFN